MRARQFDLDRFRTVLKPSKTVLRPSQDPLETVADRLVLGVGDGVLVVVDRGLDGAEVHGRRSLWCVWRAVK